MGALLVVGVVILVVISRRHLVKLLLRIVKALSSFSIEDLVYLGWPFGIPQGQFTYFSTVDPIPEPSWYRYVNKKE